MRVPGIPEKRLRFRWGALSLFLTLASVCYASTFFNAKLTFNCDDFVRSNATKERHAHIPFDWTHFLLSHLSPVVVYQLSETRDGPAISPSLYNWEPGNATLSLNATLKRGWYYFSVAYPAFNTTRQCIVSGPLQRSTEKAPEWRVLIVEFLAFAFVFVVCFAIASVVVIAALVWVFRCCVTYE